MVAKSNKVKELLTAKRIAIPLIIGLAVAAYLLWSSTDWTEFDKITWGVRFFFWMFVALLMMGLRDVAYMYRIRILTDKQIGWRNSFDVIMLWEFSSAVTPGIVGGAGVAVYILNKEGLSVGKSTAMVMTTALLDELFYVFTVPIVILIIGTQYLFPMELQKEIFGITLNVKGIFIAGYCFTLLLSLIIVYGVFINPKGFKNLLVKLFEWRLLRKWKHKVVQIGDDIITTSAELTNKSFSFWIKAFVATLFAWTSRFWVVNFLILAFIPLGEDILSVGDHLLIYGRQLVMWIIMFVSPTPGGTGIAEFAFKGFLAEFTPIGLAALLAVIWRILGYYPYLFIGAIVIPKWIKRVYS